MHFLGVGEGHALALGAHALARHVVKTSTTSCEGTMMGSPLAGERMLFDDIMSARASSCASRDSARARPSVAVEVGVERRTHERMQLNGLAFDEHGLERLDAQAMQSRRTVQEHRMLADDFLEDVPPFRSSRSTRRFAALIVEASPRSCSFWKMKGLKSSSAIFFGNPH